MECLPAALMAVCQQYQPGTSSQASNTQSHMEFTGMWIKLWTISCNPYLDLKHSQNGLCVVSIVSVSWEWKDIRFCLFSLLSHLNWFKAKVCCCSNIVGEGPEFHSKQKHTWFVSANSCLMIYYRSISRVWCILTSRKHSMIDVSSFQLKATCMFISCII